MVRKPSYQYYSVIPFNSVLFRYIFPYLIYLSMLIYLYIYLEVSTKGHFLSQIFTRFGEGRGPKLGNNHNNLFYPGINRYDIDIFTDGYSYQKGEHCNIVEIGNKRLKNWEIIW